MIQSGCTRRQVGLAATTTGKGPKLGVSRSLLQQRGRHIGPKGLVRRDVQVRVADLDSEALFPVYYDSEKEQSRKYRRTVFTHEDWFKHRSTGRYKRHLLGMLDSRIVRSLTWPVSFVVINCTLLCLYEYGREQHILPSYMPTLVLPSSEPFNLTNLTLSLLLVFRTNTSHARWLDARMIWGKIVNRTRDLARQGMTWISPEKEGLINMLSRWTIAYPRSLKAHLTYNVDLRAELEHILLEDELESLLRSPHRPNYVARMLAEIIRNAELTPQMAWVMDHNLSIFSDTTGGCERIFKTPIPLSWTRHTSRFLMLWLTFLPCILYRTCHFATPLAGFIISVSLLACDEISVSLEEPFSILALDAMCDGIEKSIIDMGKERDECEALVEVQLPSGSDASKNHAYSSRNGN